MKIKTKINRIKEVKPLYKIWDIVEASDHFNIYQWTITSLIVNRSTWEIRYKTTFSWNLELLESEINNSLI